ncbi:hypothetical protein RSAG8_04673, partial [Rhizoctonia solani AG-8 WAC10335]
MHETLSHLVSKWPHEPVDLEDYRLFWTYSPFHVNQNSTKLINVFVQVLDVVGLGH